MLRVEEVQSGLHYDSDEEESRPFLHFFQQFENTSEYLSRFSRSAGKPPKSMEEVRQDLLNKTNFRFDPNFALNLKVKVDFVCRYNITVAALKVRYRDHFGKSIYEERSKFKTAALYLEWRRWFKFFVWNEFPEDEAQEYNYSVYQDRAIVQG